MNLDLHVNHTRLTAVFPPFHHAALLIKSAFPYLLCLITKYKEGIMQGI